MDQTKITKLLRLMKLLTGNVNRSIDSLAAEMGLTSRTIYRYIDTIREAVAQYDADVKSGAFPCAEESY